MAMLVLFFIMRTNKSKVQSSNTPVVHEQTGSMSYTDLVPNRLLTDEDYMQFKRNFEHTYPKFITKLNLNYHQLSLGDEKLILLMKLGLNHKEIAAILGISDASVRKKQLRLKNKLKLAKRDSLDSFIFELGNNMK